MSGVKRLTPGTHVLYSSEHVCDLHSPPCIQGLKSRTDPCVTEGNELGIAD